YDPVIARFFSPDPFVQAPDFSQNFNRYSYVMNNPLVYTDPSGELAWFVPIIIGAAVFGTGNLVAHAVRGDVNNFVDGVQYFGQGALAGAVLGAAWQFAPLIPGIGAAVQTGMNIYGISQLSVAGVSAFCAMGEGVAYDDWRQMSNVGEIFLGNFYLDENRFIGGIWQGVSRHSWEFLQTGIGHTFSQGRNFAGEVSRVDYLGGNTFVTNENTQNRMGVSIGNYSNMWIRNEIEGNFDDFVRINPLFMHEYGHSFQSRALGPLYPFIIGVPSLISAGTATQVDGEPNGVTTHDFRRYEMWANRSAAKYFERYYGVDWDLFEVRFPRRQR
ncbi:MAG: hypothetical protein JXR34_08955, partial [Bacteroidales bacterium]|nr:hypothetical protein [Bacteroidales bacterium]